MNESTSQKSTLVFGLDLGTTSIGWAVVRPEQEKIVGMGVRIFPIGVNEDDYNKNFKETSKSKDRRTARMARRRKHRLHLRRENLTKLLKIRGLYDENLPQNESIYEWRSLAVSQKIPLAQLGAILLHLNKRRGFKSSKKDASIKDKEADKELDGIKGNIQQLEKAIQEAGFQTMGQYFHHLLSKNKDAQKETGNLLRVRGRHTSRELYQKEFDTIWQQQATHYPEILTDKFRKEVRNRCIFYQRPLKSAKNLIAKCEFEHLRRVAPKASFVFQEFRIWQLLANLRVTVPSQKRYGDTLTVEEKQKGAKALQTVESMTIANLCKHIFGKSDAKLQYEEGDKVKGNTTYTKLINALTEDWWNQQSTEKQHLIWHTAYFAENEQWLYDYALKKLGMNPAQASAYSKLTFEADYGRLSDKAMKGILAHLKIGQDYSEACLSVNYDHSKNQQAFSEADLLPYLNHLEKNELRNPIVQQAISELIRVVNALLKEYGRPDVIRIEMAREFKQAKEKRENRLRDNKARRERRELHAKFLSEKLEKEVLPESDLVKKYELWLELGLENTHEKTFDKDLPIFLNFTRKIDDKTQTKYRLWLEADRRSPYTGKTISLTALLQENSPIEIEHIIPYSRSMDNSWANLTLSEKWFNNEKGNQTPYEYFQKRPEHERIAFRERVQIFPKAKREKFLAANIEQDFNPNQLTDTAYIARYARGLLHKICLKVEPTIGGTTAFLREKWQLDSLLAPKKRVEQIIKEQNEGLVVKMSKNRGDHRHHAVDALVIALTDIRYVQILSRDSQFNNGKFDNPKIPKEPWKEFKLQVGDFLKGLYISHRSKNRLIQKRALKKKDKNAPKSYSTAIRGQLHKETFYGARKFPHHFSKKFAFGEEVFEERKALEALKDKDLDAILDLKVRQQIEAYAAQYNKGKVEGAFVNLKENPLWMYSTKGAKVPIKKVRLAFKASSLIEVHPKTFVESGDNYVLGIYRSDDGKITEVELVKFFEAVKRKKAGSAILPSHKTKKGQQLPLVYTLHKGDMFILYEEHEDAIEWNNPAYLLRRLYKVSIVAKNGAVATIYLVHHRSARPNEYTPQPVPEGKTDLGKPKVYRGSGNFKGVPVRIDRLGNIVRLSDGKVIKGGGQ